MHTTQERADQVFAEADRLATLAPIDLAMWCERHLHALTSRFSELADRITTVCPPGSRLHSADEMRRAAAKLEDGAATLRARAEKMAVVHG